MNRSVNHRTAGGAGRWIILALVGIGIVAAVFAVVRRNAGPETQRTLVGRVESGEFRREVSGTGTIASATERDVSFASAGTINAILVAEGDEVAAGDVLATLETGSLERDLASTSSSLVSARAELNRTQAQQQVDQLDLENTTLSARNTVAVAEEALATAQATFAVTSRLFERGAASQNELDTARETVTNAERDLSTARISLQSAETRVNSSASLTDAQLASARAQISALETTIGNIEEQISEAQLSAPFAGTVSAIGFEVGDTAPTPGGIELVDISNLFVRTTFDENRAAELRSGQSATITPDADASQTLAATVRRVSRVAVRNNSAAQVDAELDFDDELSEDQKGLVRPGFTVTTRVSVNDIGEALLVPLEAITEENGVSYVYKVTEEDDAQAQRVTLDVLDRNATIAAAESDALAAGDLIALINLSDIEDGTLLSFDPLEDDEATSETSGVADEVAEETVDPSTDEVDGTSESIEEDAADDTADEATP